MTKGKVLLLLILCAGIMAGCATTKQGVEDYKMGATTPLQPVIDPATGQPVLDMAGNPVMEQSPRQSVQPIIDVVSGIPVVGGYAPLIGGLLAGIATWRRGRRIRKSQSISMNPITGHWGSSIGLEGLVQNLSNIITGIFEVGKEGSGLKRGWKVGLSTALSIGAGALTIPAVQDFVVSNPNIAATIVGLSALFGGLEKEVSKVLPVPPKPV